MFTKAKDNIRRLFKDIDGVFDKLGYDKWLKEGGIIDNTPNRNFNGMYSFAETKNKATRDKLIAFLDQANGVIKENTQIFGQYGTYSGLNDTELYRRLAGEVEARNVQTRAKMPMSERRVKPISRTEDVSRDNQIMMFDNPKFQLPEDAKFQLPERSRTALNEMTLS